MNVNQTRFVIVVHTLCFALGNQNYVSTGIQSHDCYQVIRLGDVSMAVLLYRGKTQLIINCLNLTQMFMRLGNTLFLLILLNV